MSRLISINAAQHNPVTPEGKFTPEMIRLFQEIVSNRRINTGVAQPMTIASGVITLGANFSYFVVDTQAAAASDDLDTISNGNEGDLIFIKAANAARTVVLKDGSGNIKTNGGADLSLDNSDDLAVLHFDGTSWKADLWNVSA